MTGRVRRPCPCPCPMVPTLSVWCRSGVYGEQLTAIAAHGHAATWSTRARPSLRARDALPRYLGGARVDGAVGNGHGLEHHAEPRRRIHLHPHHGGSAPQRAAVASASSRRSSTPPCGASSRTSVLRPRCRSRCPPARRLRRPGSRSSPSADRPSASRPTSVCGGDSGVDALHPQNARGTRAGAQPMPRARLARESKQNHLELAPERVVPKTPRPGLRACPTRPSKAPAAGPLSRCRSCNRASMAAIPLDLLGLTNTTKGVLLSLLLTTLTAIENFLPVASPFLSPLKGLSTLHTYSWRISIPRL